MIQPRYLLVITATFALALSLGAINARADTAQIRVASYNIHHGAPRGVNDCNDTVPDRCVALITNVGNLLENFDVVGLQEVDRFVSRSSPANCREDNEVACIDQTAFLADQLDMYSCFESNVEIGGGEFGNAILSRTPILDCVHAFLPCETAEDGSCLNEQRGILTARIEVNGTSFVFFSAHFDSAADPTDRALQGAFVADLLNAANDPAILVGDFNAEPDDPELNPIRGSMLDVWDEAGEGDGATIGDKRIDYIMVSGDISAQHAEVLRDPEPSDHFLLIADVSVPGADGIPIAQCRNVTVSASPDTCTADASVDDGSFQTCDKPLTLTQAPPAPYGLGETNVTLEAADANGETDQCAAVVTVIDDTPPSIEVISAEPNVLWPPNHELVPVSVDVTAIDACGDVQCRIVGIDSSESENAPGDGNTAPDTVITGILTANLRAERQGRGDGRVYTLTVRCTDASGNDATASTTITAPQNWE